MFCFGQGYNEPYWIHCNTVFKIKTCIFLNLAKNDQLSYVFLKFTNIFWPCLLRKCLYLISSSVECVYIRTIMQQSVKPYQQQYILNSVSKWLERTTMDLYVNVGLVFLKQLQHFCVSDEKREWQACKETDKEGVIVKTDLRSASISLGLVFLLQKKPLFNCTLYWMLWKLTVEPHGCLLWSMAGAVPLVLISSIIAMLMWLALSIILCSE